VSDIVLSNKAGHSDWRLEQLLPSSAYLSFWFTFCFCLLMHYFYSIAIALHIFYLLSILGREGTHLICLKCERRCSDITDNICHGDIGARAERLKCGGDNHLHVAPQTGKQCQCLTQIRPRADSTAPFSNANTYGMCAKKPSPAQRIHNAPCRLPIRVMNTSIDHSIK
jgi:hypothetical protein